MQTWKEENGKVLLQKKVNISFGGGIRVGVKFTSDNERAFSATGSRFDSQDDNYVLDLAGQSVLVSLRFSLLHTTTCIHACVIQHK